MPTTYNGVGTHYYGKKNIQKRPGTCRQCGRNVELTSYDTRLWFVFLFIPLIPLARKRILDYCPACTRHYAMELNKWETARQLEVSGALEQFRSHPTPEGAIAAHQQLLNFHQLEEAAAFRKTMVEKFPDHAKIEAYLGGAAAHLGKFDEAMKHFQRALTLRSDLPEARVGVARGHIREKQLDEARKLLDFLEKPGAAQLYSLEPLETLAFAYQQAGEHRLALELFGRLQAELPKIAEHKPFRDAVKKSEKALGQGDSILPKQKFSWQRLFQGGAGRRPAGRTLLVLGVVLALVALGFAIANEYIRRHRTLHLVNAFRQPATVTISGAGTERFSGMRTLTLAEGTYHVVIDGPIHEEFDFQIQEGYFSRWFSEPAWVLNVGGAAVLVEETAIYSQAPPPPDLTFHCGKSFERFANVTHAFTPLPPSMQVESGGNRTLVQLDLYNGDGSDLFQYFSSKRDPAGAMSFAESWLRAHPEDSAVLRLYSTVAERQKQPGRVDAFLQTGLTNRPVRVEWHRYYQAAHDHPAEHPALVARYDGMLRAEPTNSALLYLRGRLEYSRSQARRFHEQAAAADPQSPYPPFALGFASTVGGDWDGAKLLFTRAVELAPHETGYQHLLALTRLALGEAEGVEQDMRKRVAENPLDSLSEILLVDSLAEQNHGPAALEAFTAFQRACNAKYKSAGQALINTIYYHTLYAIGDFATLKTATEKDQSATGREMLAAALVEQGQVVEAIKVLPAEIEGEDKPAFALALSVACRQAGNGAEAEQWKSRAVQALQAGGVDDGQAAAWLTGATPPTTAEAQDLLLTPRLKAVLLTELSQQHPQARKELAALARRLNVDRRFPFHLVRRITGETP